MKTDIGIRRKRGAGDLLLDFVLDNKSLVILLIICIAATFLSEHFLTFTNIRNVIRQVVVSAILALGFTLILGSGHIDLSVGCQLGLIGVLMAKVSKAGVPLPLVLLIGLAIGACTGALNAAAINSFSLPPFIVTLSTASIYKGAVYLISKMTPVSNIPKSFINIGQGYILSIPIPVLIMFVVLIIMWFVVKKTLFGRHAIAMGGNIEAARVCGINVRRVRLAVYSVMGMYAAIAAFVLTGRSASAQVAAGQGMEMNAIAAVVLGGTPMGGGYAYVPNTIVGCLIVGVVANILNLLNVDVNWQEVAKGALILFAIILDSQSNAIKARRARNERMGTLKKEKTA
jgi:ribose/xylose/arabinose/galactoside ABC-type transport system permease subunit